MLEGELLVLLKAVQYLVGKISVSGENGDANSADLAAIEITYKLPLTYGELLSLVEASLKEVYLKIIELIGKMYWDAIIEEYDNSLAKYFSKEYEKGLKSKFGI
jgi:hypothetical protein